MTVQACAFYNWCHLLYGRRPTAEGVLPVGGVHEIGPLECQVVTPFSHTHTSEIHDRISRKYITFQLGNGSSCLFTVYLTAIDLPGYITGPATNSRSLWNDK